MILTAPEFASLLRVTEKTVSLWTKAGMPVANQGTPGRSANKTLIDLEPAIRWYFEKNHERLELERQRTRLASEQAQKLAIENAVRIGEVGEFNVWQRELEQLFSEIRSGFLAFPTKLAPRLDGDVNQRKDRLEAAVQELLRQLSAYRPSKAGKGSGRSNDTGSEDIHPAAEADGKSVGRQVPKAVKGKQRRAG